MTSNQNPWLTIEEVLIAIAPREDFLGVFPANLSAHDARMLKAAAGLARWSFLSNDNLADQPLPDRIRSRLLNAADAFINAPNGKKPTTSKRT